MMHYTKFKIQENYVIIRFLENIKCANTFLPIITLLKNLNRKNILDRNTVKITLLTKSTIILRKIK